jgi:hypothetical protein
MGRVTRWGEFSHNYWAMVFFGKFLKDYRSRPKLCLLFSHRPGLILTFPKNGLAAFLAIFSQTHLVTLSAGRQQFKSTKFCFYAFNATKLSVEIF